MKVLIILALIAAVLVLISLIRLGVQVIYVPSGLTVKVKAGPIWVRVLPRKKKKQKKHTKKGEDKPQPEEKNGDMLGQIRRALPLIAEAAGRHLFGCDRRGAGSRQRRTGVWRCQCGHRYDLAPGGAEF